MELKPIQNSDTCALYELDRLAGAARFVGSTPETRRICNDPTIVGIEYTRLLQAAVARLLSAIPFERWQLVEQEAVVLHVLRGGLNFGLREALGEAFGWNRHASAFISAQRACHVATDDWYITESDYAKVYLPEVADIVFGDVVATGTSLEFALKRLLGEVETRGTQIRSVLFFTIGGPRSEEILAAMDAECRRNFPCYEGCAVVYIEGRFAVADSASPVTVKVAGTDLLRRGAVLAPEFVESQYENPAYPLERCAIYDAGSRAFWLPEYLSDVVEYWVQTRALAGAGTTFAELLAERFPSLDPDRFGDVELAQLCDRQLAALRGLV